MAKPQRQEYGVYTVGDENFFAGIVAAVNSLKYHGYHGPIAVIDIGFNEWMKSYLAAFENVALLDIEPVRKDIRFVDVKSDESPVMKGWAYKAFSIVHYDLFDNWTFIDGDYLPLCNLEEELLPDIKRGHLISTEDGHNTWDERHMEAIGVEPGGYVNINGGFISLSMETYGAIVHEWRNLMTRYKPFDLWYGDQGAFNAVLDKYGVEKTCLDKVLWNQTWLNERMAIENKCSLHHENGKVFVRYEPLGAKIMGWHGTGWHKLWHQIGIDHFRKHNEVERKKFHDESQGKSPGAVVEIFRYFMFLDTYNTALAQEGHLLSPERIPRARAR